MMVGMVVGLATIAVIFQSYAAFEGRKRTTTNASDAQENGLIALRAIEADARMSGFGLLAPSGLACTSMNWYYNGAVGTSPIAPAIIYDGGGNGASDSIAFTYSDSPAGSSPAMLTSAMPTSDAFINMSSISLTGFLQNLDQFLVATPSFAGNAIPCSRLAYVDKTVTNPPPAALALYNPPTGTNIFPQGSVTGYNGFESVAINMGNFIQNQYGVSANNLAVTDVSIPNQPAIKLSSNIVNVQAQYGVAPFNPTPGSPAPAVNCWTDAAGSICNPSSGDWANPGAADIARIKAIRVAIVARSVLLEKPQKNGVCNTTTVAPVSWAGGPLIDLSADPNWQCHRYRVYQTVIPLRNVIWANI